MENNVKRFTKPSVLRADISVAEKDRGESNLNDLSVLLKWKRGEIDDFAPIEFKRSAEELYGVGFRAGNKVTIKVDLQIFKDLSDGRKKRETVFIKGIVRFVDTVDGGFDQVYLERIPAEEK